MVERVGGIGRVFDILEVYIPIMGLNISIEKGIGEGKIEIEFVNAEFEVKTRILEEFL